MTDHDAKSVAVCRSLGFTAYTVDEFFRSPNAVLIPGLGFVVWAVVVSRIKLGVAFAISGAFFYILVAMSNWLLSGERLATIQGIGIVLLSIGVLLIAQFGKP